MLVQHAKHLVNVVSPQKKVRMSVNKLVGTFVALKDANGKVCVGWSKRAKSDKFNKEDGIAIATGRAMQMFVTGVETLPKSEKFRESFFHFLSRAEKFYKQKIEMEWKVVDRH